MLFTQIVDSYNMSSVAKTEFEQLDANGMNYMSWTLDMQSKLESMGILDTINENNDSSSKDKSTAYVFLRKHIDIMLRLEYPNVKDPSVLWAILKRRFNIQKEVLLPTARDQWRNLRFQDFKKVNEYSSAMFRIVATLEFCGDRVTDEDMLEKTYSTFHSSNINLMQQYRLMNFKKYSDLNAFLLIAEQNQELLMKNQARPAGSLALAEANATNKDDSKNNTNRWGRGRGRGTNYRYNHNHNGGRNSNSNSRGRGRGHGRGRGRGYIRNYHNGPYDNKSQPQRRNHDAGASTSKNPDNICYRCGSTGHWSKMCRTQEHLCKLYKASIAGKNKEVNLADDLEFTNVEMNAADYCNDIDI